MIIGTAGHIDHGKTTLVRALTGVQTDRLDEEKSRGITIELGYAYMPLDNGEVLGFIDVPGHERLVHTMAAGASGIDFGLLVVAADDGVMPQTREHLAILGLLGVQRGAVALTKADRTDPLCVDEVTGQIEALVAGTFLQGMPVFALNATDDCSPGVSGLLAHLKTVAQQAGPSSAQGLFRLAVDRVFSLPGHGTIVTGTVHDGVVSIFDDRLGLRLMPQGRAVRVRSIHAQNRASSEGRAGQRCALNLAGIELDGVRRGDWIADERCFVPSRNMDVQLTLLSTADAPLRAWTPLHLHLGAAHQVVHAVPLSPDPLPCGQSGWVQLVFDEPVCAMAGDHFIIRNAQANQTIGGGMVLDANAPDRKRRSPRRLAWLDAVARYKRGASLAGVLEQAAHGLTEAHLQRLAAGTPPQDLPADALWVEPRTGGIRTLILRQHWEALQQTVVQAVCDFHQHWPDQPGLDSARLRRVALPAVDGLLWQALHDELLASGQLARNGPWLHEPGHEITLLPVEQVLAQRLLPAINEGGLDPPWVRDLASRFQRPEDTVRELLRKLVRSGELYQVVHDLFYHREQIAQLAGLLDSLGASQGVNAARFRDATGLGRKRAVQILEFFDRAGYTRRLRDQHVPRGDSVAFWQKLS